MSKVILGGGLGGLSAAYYLSKAAPNQPLTLLELSSRTGGWIKSNLGENGALFEQGPHTIRPRGDAGVNTLQLLEELNLDNQIVPILSNEPAAQKRIIYAKGSPHLLPTSVFGLFKKQEPFTKPLILHLANDLWAKRKKVDDESIYDFVKRRFGEEVADFLISPLICGICAGNAKEISVNFLMSKLFEHEQEYGSISQGLLRNFSLKSTNSIKLSGLALKAKKQKWSVYSFINGCETLPLALKQSIANNVNIRLNCECKEIIVDQNHVILTINDKKREIVATDHLISAVPANVLGQLLEKQHPDLSNLLISLTKNVSVAVINLQFKENLVKEPAFGLLVAPKEKLPILGIIYDSCCFPELNNGTVLTVMMGGFWFEELFGSTPNEEMLLQTAITQVKDILKINENPIESKVNVLQDCIPQYVVGHGKNLREINNYIKRRKLPISLCGSSYYGVGVNDVIFSAKKAVNNLS